MFNANDLCVIVPARSGSKGIPNKNIRVINGKSLLERTLDSAEKLVKLDNVCLSSDSKEYDGSSWTAGGSLINSRQNCTGASSQALQTAAFIAGGDAPPPGAITTTETYDGTSFATSQNISTARFSNSASSTQTSALVFGGRTPSNSNATEEFTAETSAANVTDFTTS